MESPVTDPPAHLGLVDRSRIALACGVAILMMYGVGWNVVRPTDLLLGLTFTHSGRSSFLPIWLMMMVLAAVTAAIATAVAGKRLPGAGLFATGIGMTAMALRGGSMQMILGYFSGADTAGRKALMFSMGRDAILWAAVMAVAWATSAIAAKWLWIDSAAHEAKTDKPTTPQLGAAALASTLIVALIFIWLTIARTPVAEIARGQVIATVALGLFLGAMAGRTVTAVASISWYLGAVALVALTAYLVGYLQADMGWATTAFRALATTPPHELVRPLPVEYLAVGVPAALAGFWCADKVEQTAEEAGQ